MRISKSLPCRQHLMDILFTMGDLHLETIFLIDMLCKMLCGVDRTVLSAGTPETEHQRCEASLHVPLHMMIGKLVHWLEEFYYLTVILKEADDRLVESRQLLIRLIASGIMSAATVEDISSSIAAGILRDALTVREAEDMNHERPLAVILRECRRTIQWIALIDIIIRGTQAVGTRFGWFLYHGELRQLR